ncbi:MAG: Tn3 family transposase [Candidatus Scalindua sp.]
MDYKIPLWEYDNILMSLHNLDYIDDIIYRQNIQKALCRSENYNQLFKAIPYADGGKFRVEG